jgi:hypothetical protein
VLDAESYQNAWLAYTAATLGALLVLYLWIGSRWSRVTRLGWALLLGALALAPAHPDLETTTWAPAIFVTAFEMFTHGTDAALRPARSLISGAALAIALWLLMALAGRFLGRSAAESA